MDVFKNMLHELAVGRENPDGADQGFLASYFPDLLDQPMFHPPANGTKLDGNYRLPLGYQMDASYYCEYEYRYIIIPYAFSWLRPINCTSFRFEAPVEYSVWTE